MYKYRIYCQEVLLQQKDNLANKNFRNVFFVLFSFPALVHVIDALVWPSCLPIWPSCLPNIGYQLKLSSININSSSSVYTVIELIKPPTPLQLHAKLSLPVITSVCCLVEEKQFWNQISCSLNQCNDQIFRFSTGK